jgi:hypothetical protein
VAFVQLPTLLDHLSMSSVLFTGRTVKNVILN